MEPYRAEPEPPLAFAPEPIWRSSALGGDSALGDLVTDAWRRESGADIVLLNSSGLRSDLEQGLLLRSDLELALPFDEPWLLTLVTGAEVARGLEHAARRSSERDCESVLQVSGLTLEIACSACATETETCLRVERLTPFGPLPLRADEPLLVALPEYLARPGADFAELQRSTVQQLDRPASGVLARHLARSRGGGAADRCVEEARSLSGERCREVAGALACPPGVAAASALCAELPRVRGARDDRIRLVP
jgi:2',3'-cyclic-nucleotide 2'-phosphodiesterase (5'-nucleotidase family)